MATKKADEMKGEKYASQYRPLRAGAIYFMAKRKRQCHERATKISPENQSWHWHRTEGNEWTRRAHTENSDN
jgi:hypothetical protein